MIGLVFKGYLEGVTDFKFKDSVADPFYFTFIVQCSKCHEVHDNEVKFQQHHQEQLPNSRGEANFILRCKFCGNVGHLNVHIDDKAAYTSDLAGKPKTLASFDLRGIDLVKFQPDGEFSAKSDTGKATFQLEFEDDGDWFGYDEDAGAQVSITETEWTIAKQK